MDRRLDTLSLAAAAFVAANLLHTLDHLRQGTGDLATEVLAGGTVISILAVLTLVLALRRHPRAALWAAVVGTWSALGVIASHMAPHWSALQRLLLRDPRRRAVVGGHARRGGGRGLPRARRLQGASPARWRFSASTARCAAVRRVSGSSQSVR